MSETKYNPEPKEGFRFCPSCGEETPEKPIFVTNTCIHCDENFKTMPLGGSQDQYWSPRLKVLRKRR